MLAQIYSIYDTRDPLCAGLDNNNNSENVLWI